MKIRTLIWETFGHRSYCHCGSNEIGKIIKQNDNKGMDYYEAWDNSDDCQEFGTFDEAIKWVEMQFADFVNSISE